MEMKNKPGNSIKTLKPFFILLIILFFNKAVFAATISAQLDINPVLVNDSFHLTYTAEGSVDNDPDFSPVKKYFDILGTQTSNNISMINGSFKRTQQWTLTLIATKTGTYRIPPVAFGTDLAPEVEVTVKQVPVSGTASPTQDFFIKLESSTQSAFIQQQVLLTAKLYVAQNINSYQFGDINTNNQDTIIEQLGDDKQYKTYLGTKPYIVLERKYAIFPQASGKLKIKSLLAEIGIVTRRSSGRFFDPFNASTTTKRVRSKELTINIKDIPKSFSGNNWIATPSLKLIENWPRNTTFRAGEPITRTLTLIADKQIAEQLPELNLPDIKGLKQYPDKPYLNNSKQTTGINATRKQKIALIPTHAGTYTLPAIDIPWWNTKKNKIDIAHISARSFKVLPSANPINNTPQFNQQKQLDLNTNKIPLTNNNTTTLRNNSSSLTQAYWFWLSLLFLILWLATLVLLLRSKKQPVRNKQNHVENNLSLSNALNVIKSACNRNNAQETKTALLRWGKVIFSDKPPINLAELAELLDEELKSKILRLNEALYSADDTIWKCDGIYNLCKQYKQKTESTKEEDSNNKLEPFKP